MTALSSAAAIALALQCAPSVDAHTLIGIAQRESGLQPLAIHDNTSGKALVLDDKAKAVSEAEKLINQGHSVDVGLMQVNSGNFGWLNITVQEALDPCRSIEAGAKVLTAFSRYNTGSPTKGISSGYAIAVSDSVHRVKADGGSPSVTEVSPTLQQKKTSFECQAQAWDVWGMEECSRKQRGAAPVESNPTPKEPEYP